jgi:hypothetical protein
MVLATAVSRRRVGQVQPTALLDFYGNISLETSKIILQYHQTGDVHIAAYDFDGDEMFLAIGKINIDGKYNYSGNDGLWCAYSRPWLKFSLNDFLFATSLRIATYLNHNLKTTTVNFLCNNQDCGDLLVRT